MILLDNLGGGHAQAGRETSPGHARHAHPEGALAGRAPRLRRGAAHHADVGRRAAGRGGLALPRPLPHRAAGLDHLRVGRLREQPARQVLPADARRAHTAPGRGRELGAPGGGRLQGDGGELKMAALYWLRLLRARLRGLLRKRSVEREMEEELRFHLGMRAAENVRAGMAPEEAERAALRSFGQVSRVKEYCRDFKGGGLVETLLQDVKFGARTLLKNRGFTLVAVLTLAVGIGANTAIFSVVNAVLLRPLPYRDPARLVTVLHDGWKPVAPANFLDWREQGRSFESIAAAQSWSLTMTGRDRPEQLNVLQTSAEMFHVLGVDAALGRAYAAGEDQPGRGRVVVLSHRLWVRRFGGDRNVVGQQVTLDGESYTVVGVMPPDFQFAPFWATHAEAWLPLDLGERVNDRRGQSLRVFARLKPDVTREQAQAEMEAVNRRLAGQYPRENEGLTVSVDPLHEKVVGKSRLALLVMLGAVGFVLLIACANVANLMLAKAAARQKEIAVRIALGAGRWRVIRQLLTESLMLSLAGGGAGLLLAYWSNTALASLGPDTLPRVQTVGLDASVLVFTLGISVLVGLLFGLAPALRSSKTDLTE